MPYDNDGYYEEGNCYKVRNLVPKAISGDAYATAELWRELAEDCSSADPGDLREWLQYVAKRIVADVIDADNEARGKAEAARRAVGLSGQISGAALRLYVEERDSILEGFTAIDDEGNPIPYEDLGLRWRDHLQMAAEVIAQGLVEAPDACDDRRHLMKIAKRIKRIRENLA